LSWDCSGWRLGRGEHVERADGDLAYVFWSYHCVDQPVQVEVLGGLYSGMERRSVQGSLDAWAEQSDQCAGLGGGDVPE
jgi:hypothetical protein